MCRGRLETVSALLDEGMTRFRYYVGTNVDASERLLGAIGDRFGSRITMKAFDFQGHFYWKDTLRVFDRLAAYGVEVIEKRELERGLRRHGRGAAPGAGRRLRAHLELRPGVCA
jgi:hypothetical protein